MMFNLNDVRNHTELGTGYTKDAMLNLCADEITSLRAELEIAKKDGWISVDTALPDYDSVRQKRLRVLVHWKDTGVVFTLWYGKRFGHNKASFFEENDWDESDYGQIDEGDNLLFGDTLTYKNITHWQPLPEPPKE